MRARLLAIALASVLAAPALAQTGVSDDRVSLPDGPGSLDGLGDNASVNANMGLMSQSVSFVVPEGFGDVTPSLSLSYSSGGGQSVAGFGWSMSVPFIERMTARGLPLYDDTDRFVVGGSEQLVAVDDAEPRTYRARYEGGFARYRWNERGAGDEGYWTAEYPDGRVDFYGADENGTSVGTARVRSPNGVFRYLLVATVDPYGHKATYDYSFFGSVPLLDFVGWVYAGGTNPAYSMTFDYEDRDDRVSDASGGFNELLAHRLSAVHVYAGTTELTRYELGYEPYATSGGVSRLIDVTRFGKDGGEHPIKFEFEYSRALGSLCAGGDCAGPFLTDLGSIGSNVLESGRGTLMDMNGDSLPDLIVSAVGQPHEIYLSELDEDLVHSFAPPYSSGISQTSSFVLTDNTVQELDYDGDGFADLVNQVTGSVLVNKGTGDWDGAPILIASTGLPAEDFDDSAAPSAADGELQNIKYFDYDGDHRIDILKTVSGGGTTILRNLGGGGYMNAAGVEDIGATFTDDNLELADMNGDGLLDPVRLQVTGISYKLNLGRGKWQTTWTTLGNSPVMLDADLPFSSLEDLNGDGIDDIVVVQADEIRYAINRNGEAFEPVQTITAAGGTTIPLRDAATTVLFADMNGNGSNDVVWVDGAGNVTYLEMFPVRPNLLSRVTNGVGMITEVSYGTSIEQRARDLGVGWDDPIPSPMVIVESIDTWAAKDAEADEIRDLVTFDYAAGYYDGAEKQWRGFAQVTLSKEGDDHQQGNAVTEIYDVGVQTSPAADLPNGETWNARGHFAGRLLGRVTSVDDGPIKTTTLTYDDCPVAGVPSTGLDFPIQWACGTSQTDLEQEARPADEWVTMRTDTTWDGWGNQILVTEHGVVAVGGGPCAACTEGDGIYGRPCGELCLGDEQINERSYADPVANGIWRLGLETESKVRVADGAREAITRTYYDGDPFVGLPLGEATLGDITRKVEVADDSGATVPILRAQYDSHGNVTEEIGANGELSGGHRQRVGYSADGLDVLNETVDVSGPDGAYQMRRDYSYDPLFGNIDAATQWYIVGETTAETASWRYDEFGRVAARLEPGDGANTPTEEYRYEWGGNVNASRVLKRSAPGGEQDVEEVTCRDGLGREIQTRSKIDDGRWSVSGYRVLNRKGNAIRVYQPFEASDDDCNGQAPAAVAYTEHFYDGVGREIRVVEPDEDERGTASERRVEYRPLAQVLWSEDDTDASSPHADTPSTLRYDGLGRVIAAERLLTALGAPQRYEIQYDDMGSLRGYVDPEGETKVQLRDRLGRVTEVTDGDHGTHRFTYDAAGNLLREVNGAGRVTVREYDELGRKTAEWDDADKEGTLAEVFYDKHPACPQITCAGGEGMPVGMRYKTPDLGDVVEGFGFDERKRHVVTVREVAGTSFLFESSYDNAGRLVKETLPDGREVEYTLDDASRIVAIPGYVDSIEHDDRGLLAAYTLANGVRTEVGYDDRLELRKIKADGAAAVVDLDIERNRLGNVTAIADAAAPADAASSTVALTYDALGRMLSAALDEGEGFGETISLEYDEVDRILSKTSTDTQSAAHVGEYGYTGGPTHGVTTAGETAWAYDDGGFARERGDAELTWNSLGRVETVSGAGGSTRWTYDSAGGLVAKQRGAALNLYLARTFEVRDGVGRLVIGIDGTPVAEEDAIDLAARLLPDDGDGVIDASDAWAERGTAELGALLRSSARRVLVEAGAARAYLHKDHLGSTIAVTNDDGAVTQRFAYYPFGAVRHSSAKQTEHASFSGVEHDATGLLHYRERVLAPEDGRWLSADPGFIVLDDFALDKLVDAVAGYSYGQNNPLTLIDRDGNFPWKKAALIAGAVVLAAAVVTAAVFAAPVVAGAAIAAAGVAAYIGAAVGGVAGGTTEAVVQRNKLKTQYRGQKIPTSAKLKAAGSVALMGAIGAVSGFFTGGLAATAGAAAAGVGIQVASTAAQGGISVAEDQGRIGGKTATALRLATGAVGGVSASAAIGLFSSGTTTALRTAGAQAATTSLSGVFEGTSAKERKSLRKKGRAIRKAKKLSKALKKFFKKKDAAKAKAKAKSD